ncbi:MAG TPA: formate dehydrogenase subunit alpha, partial [Methanobacterium sp.]|nr:formate dehydrogenase subunit alpha [Methanobacterium sp.]
GFRGYDTKITTFGDRPIRDSTCVSCGECVVRCPVGALVLKEGQKPSREVKTTCPYCSVGCNLYLGVRGNEIIGVRGDRNNNLNKGNLCVKGRFGYNFVSHPDRLTSPLIKRNGKFEEVSWDEALDFISKNLKKYHGNDFATISSCRCTNEDNYVAQKFTRVVMGTNNVDNCARSCHAPSVAGLSQTLGSGAMSNSVDEIRDSECLFIIGTNPTESYPIIGMRIVEAAKKGAKLIIADPREIELTKHAYLHLNHKPGTDIALLMGIMRVIVDEGLQDQEFIDSRCENFDEFKESLEEFDLDSVEKITGVDKEKIQEAARLYATTKPASILYSLGITEHSHGTENVFALSNLAILTGNIGKPSTGVNPIRGQNNVQGACDMGTLPNVYPGYQNVNDPEIHAKFEKMWNAKLDDSMGMKMPCVVGASSKGRVRALYIIGENIALSEPDSSSIVKSLENLEFLIVQDIFLTETAQLADVVLPAASYAEKDGTFTNTERRVQRVRKAVEAPGESKPDWEITSAIARRMGTEGFDFKNASEVMDEIADVAPMFAGIRYDRIEEEGLQWPCVHEEDLGTPRLHVESFATPNGKAKFMPLHYRPSAELPDEEYPLILTTGRSIYHYHTATMTGATEGLVELYGMDPVEMSPEDAAELGFEDGEIVKVISRRGEIKTKVKVTDVSPKGVVFMTFHFGETPTNVLTNPAMDPIAHTPEFKVCAVRVEKE